MDPKDPDILAIAEKEGLFRLPWKPELVWCPSDLTMGGELVEQSPRNVLKAMIKKAASKGFYMKTGVECEFFLVKNVKGKIVPADVEDTSEKPCYDAGLLSTQYPFISELVRHMEKLEWGIYQCDHEDANGQFEMNFNYDDCLKTADKHQFFKFMVKEVAKSHEKRATFMPKPFADKTGNGCHVHISLHDKDGKNIFAMGEEQKNNGDGDQFGLNQLAYNFLGGVMALARPLTAFCNPTLNSFRR